MTAESNSVNTTRPCDPSPRSFARFDTAWQGHKPRFDFADADDGIDVGSDGLRRDGRGGEVEGEMIGLAGDVQADTERVVLEALRRVREETGEANLCVAGGLFLNSVLNGKILDEGTFENVYIPPFVGDEGCSFGIAGMLYVAEEGGGTREELKDAFDVYCGGTYDESTDVEDEKGFLTEVEDASVDSVAAAIERGEIVFLYDGGSEVRGSKS